MIRDDDADRAILRGLKVRAAEKCVVDAAISFVDEGAEFELRRAVNELKRLRAGFTPERPKCEACGNDSVRMLGGVLLCEGCALEATPYHRGVRAWIAARAGVKEDE